MNLIDLPMNVPWLSLVWLSLVIPTLIIALLKPEQKREIRIVGAVFSFISLALTLLVYLAYDYRSPQQFQFLEEVPGCRNSASTISSVLMASVCQCCCSTVWSFSPVR